jgi:hypothetical protein
MARTAGDKFRALSHKPITEWPQSLLKSWDPKRDFAYAMLHAERLTHILADEYIAELLLQQSRLNPERASLLNRHLDRAEPRCRYLHESILTTGQHVLGKLRVAAPNTRASGAH